MEDQGKLALVTGANRGIGLEISRQLLAQGINVIVTARDPQRGAAAVEQLQGLGAEAHFAQLDVTDAQSIAALAALVEERFGRLDILVNNAGGSLDWTPQPTQPSQVSLDVARKTFEMNVFGPLAVTQALLPLLKRSPAGRIVNVSSGLGSLTELSNPDSPYGGMIMPMYQASKAALNALTLLFAKELRGTSIKVNAASPGWVDTDSGVPAWLRQAMGGNVPAVGVEQGADTPVWLATLPDNGPHGGFFTDRQPLAW